MEVVPEQQGKRSKRRLPNKTASASSLLQLPDGWWPRATPLSLHAPYTAWSGRAARLACPRPLYSTLVSRRTGSLIPHAIMLQEGDPSSFCREGEITSSVLTVSSTLCYRSDPSSFCRKGEIMSSALSPRAQHRTQRTESGDTLLSMNGGSRSVITPIGSPPSQRDHIKSTPSSPCECPLPAHTISREKVLTFGPRCVKQHGCFTVGTAVNRLGTSP
jgi:hypothetical protein